MPHHLAVDVDAAPREIRHPLRVADGSRRMQRGDGEAERMERREEIRRPVEIRVADALGFRVEC